MCVDYDDVAQQNIIEKYINIVIQKLQEINHNRQTAHYFVKWFWTIKPWYKWIIIALCQSCTIVMNFVDVIPSFNEIVICEV